MCFEIRYFQSYQQEVSYFVNTMSSKTSIQYEKPSKLCLHVCSAKFYVRTCGSTLIIHIKRSNLQWERDYQKDNKYILQ